MTDNTSANLPVFTAEDLPDNVTADAAFANRFTEKTLARHKREGLELAVRARWVALGVVAILLPILNPSWTVLYHQVLLLAMAGLAYVQQRVGRVGRSGWELAVMGLELSLMIFVITVPNPFEAGEWPTAMTLRFDTFDYLFIILAGGTLSYSWRTIMAIGNWSAGLFAIALAGMWWFGRRDPELSAAAQQAFGPDSEMARMLDPNSMNFDLRLQQIVVFVIVAYILALSVRRFNRLLLSNASLERERENLARYFSPNVVEDLSQNDEPLKQIRNHDVAVIFVDIQSFTQFASEREPEEVIGALREFHSFMERAVFAHGGTLDKYLGDGLMATFGTPFPASDDLRRAYHCARRMVDLAQDWNNTREARGEMPLTVGVGLHYGPVVLGDIGGNRLEFAVVGNTVNIASRLEALTRPLRAKLVISATVRDRLPEEEVEDLQEVPEQEIRGVTERITVWTLA